LSAYTNTLPGLDKGNLGTNTKSFPTNFYQMLDGGQKVSYNKITMTNAEREVLLSPATADCMNIRGAHPASFNLDVNIIITKWFWLELVLMEFGPCLRPIDLEARECIWIDHYETMRRKVICRE
jgi:hypothetical protein